MTALKIDAGVCSKVRSTFSRIAFMSRFSTSSSLCRERAGSRFPRRGCHIAMTAPFTLRRLRNECADVQRGDCSRPARVALMLAALVARQVSFTPAATDVRRMKQPLAPWKVGGDLSGRDKRDDYRHRNEQNCAKPRPTAGALPRPPAMKPTIIPNAVVGRR